MTTPDMQPVTQPVVLTPGIPGGIPQPDPAPLPPLDQAFDMPAEFAAEEVMFRKDGTVVWKVDRMRTVLRRPKFKELRNLNEEITALADKSREERQPLLDELRALTDPITDEITGLDTDDPATATKLIELQQALRDQQRTQEYQDVQMRLRLQRDEADYELLTWFAESVLRRFGQPPPRIDDPGDLPGWCIDATFTRDLLGHWSSVPRRPGVV